MVLSQAGLVDNNRLFFPFAPAPTCKPDNLKTPSIEVAVWRLVAVVSDRSGSVLNSLENKVYYLHVNIVFV